MPQVLEFFVPGERVRWVERTAGWATRPNGYRERFGVVDHDAGKYVAVKPDDADVLTFDGYAPMVNGDMLRMPRVHLTSAAHQSSALEER